MNSENVINFNKSLSNQESQELKELCSFLEKPAANEIKIYEFLKSKECYGSNLSEILSNWFILAKETYEDSFSENPGLVYAMFQSIKYLTFQDFKKIFPSKLSVEEQNLFDYSSSVFLTANENTDELVENYARFFVGSAFKKDKMNKNSVEQEEKDLKLLQGLFFFLIWNLASNNQLCDDEIFERSLKCGWNTPEKQAEILNLISRKCDFNCENPFSPVAYTDLSNKVFSRNESILRLLFNFTRQNSSVKEGIINELNFVRELQKSVLPVYPNTRKTNYSESAAENEIDKTRENLNKLKKIDFGFKDSNFEQALFINDAKFKMPFKREICCKCFQESAQEWFKLEFSRGKIIARRKDRVVIKNSLSNKFLYPERNKVTHVGENFAVYSLFTREYKEWEKNYRERLVLQSLYDAKVYLENFEDKEISGKIQQGLNIFFEKLTSRLNLQSDSLNEKWNEVFDEKGNIKLEFKLLEKTNMYNLLEERERKYLKHLMGLLYCTENETVDFMVKNAAKIQFYLIYISFELSCLKF